MVQLNRRMRWKIYQNDVRRHSTNHIIMLHFLHVSSLPFVVHYITVTVALSFLKITVWSLLSVCFTISLKSTPFISSSTLFWYKFLHFRLICSFTHYFFLGSFSTLLRSSLSLLAHALKTYCSSTSSSWTAFTDFYPHRFFFVSSELIGFCLLTII